MRSPLLLVTVLFAGCGSSWMPPDIQRSETVDALGAAGYSRLCSAFESYIHDEYASNYFVQAVCLYHGVSTSADASSCGDAVQSCTETLPPAAESLLQSILTQASCDAVGINPTGCAATVAQLAGCLDALEGALKGIEFTLTCSAVGQPLDDTWWQIPVPAECGAIRTICPG